MRVREIIYNDTTKYRKPSATIMMDNGGQDEEPAPAMKTEDVINEVLNGNRMSAFVFAGDEPYEQIDSIISFVKDLREYHHSDTDVVIYTDHYPIESCVVEGTDKLSEYKNIYIKWGRQLDEDEECTDVFDEVLGVRLPSDNQFGEKVS